MPRFAANCSTLYPEHAFIDRFAAAARDGFTAVECQFPYEEPPSRLAEALQQHRLELVLFNLPPGDVARGERGLLALPGREHDLDRAIAQALPYARATGCRLLHAMAGISEDTPEARRVFVANLRRAASQVADHGITLLVEPINRDDMPGYFLTRQAYAHALLAEAGAPNTNVQMNLYH